MVPCVEVPGRVPVFAVGVDETVPMAGWTSAVVTSVQGLILPDVPPLVVPVVEPVLELAETDGRADPLALEWGEDVGLDLVVIDGEPEHAAATASDAMVRAPNSVLIMPPGHANTVPPTAHDDTTGTSDA